MGSGPYYPTGAYKDTIVEQALSENDKGTAFVALKVKVNGLPANLEDYERTITLYITDAAVPYTVEKLRVVGYDRQNWKDIDPATHGYFNFVGIEAPLYCKHETGDKGTFEKWDISTPRAGKMLEPIEPSKLRKLDMMFGNALKGGAPAPVTRAKQSTAAVASGGDPMGISDDDVPF